MHRIPRRLGASLVAAVAAFGALLPIGSTASTAAASEPHRFEHVWIFVFENTDYAAVTSQSMPYFTARADEGLTLTQMYGVGHFSLTNYIALASGHEPKPETQADCFMYNCIYEAGEDDNIADQLEEAGLTWKAYMDGLPKLCPKPEEGKLDPYRDGYATRHNPFMYYRGIVDDKARCEEHIRPYTELATDLKAHRVANYNFVAPDTCHDAHNDTDENCQIDDADAWLAEQLPPILESEEYKSGGAVILTFDEAEPNDSSNCCDPSTPGGGHIATAILSPRLAGAGTSDDTKYSHYSLLRTIEDNFGLECLRHACDATTNSLITAFKEAPPATTTSATTRASVVKDEGGDDDAVDGKLIWIIGGVGILLGIGAIVSTRRTARRLSGSD